MSAAPLSVGEVCAGYGGLGLAISRIADARTDWVADPELGPRTVLAQRFPHAPNLGDITAVDWEGVEPVDIIAGGTPCQDLSSAGGRAGMRAGTRSGLWASMLTAVTTLQPRFVIWENVYGALTAPADSLMESEPGYLGGAPAGPALRAAGRVLGDLASAGYDAAWTVTSASELGFCHIRKRLFVLAARADVADAMRVGSYRPWPSRERRFGPADRDSAHVTLPTPTVQPEQAQSPGYGISLRDVIAGEFGHYMKAVIQQQKLTSVTPPCPTELSTGKVRLNPLFVEWMMGLPAGWVTGVPGLSRTQQFRLLGNGVVPQQAAAALTELADWFSQH